ncbi:uncharacterized protein LOC108026629 isoform X2 [Drosophila biarmipes]|uniref:uncharacterized protein LOC108026629 isoform X2 n=1 Tax=Drosophila biarmipes TaxID=125945 RepID=UPI0007E8A8FA|nr:uncharacterized protein LOC108026629 isoform X2 [Drosophila biarmipes]
MSSTKISLGRLKSYGGFSWQAIGRKLKSFPRLETFLYFFDLETGCRIIALFEALVSVLQICHIYHLANQPRPSVILPDPFWITKIERDRIINRMFLYHTNQHFLMSLCLVTVLNSVLLIIGSKWGHQVCFFLWMYITLFTTVMTTCNNTIRNLTFMQCFWIFPTFTLEVYFAWVVASLMCKFHEKPNGRESDIEVLSSESEEL